jgi:histidine triad (HIT) family protein
MNATNCIFCKILAKEVPATLIYENEHVLAFLDITPINPGHTLIIPKSHYENMFELPEELTLEMMRAVKKISHGIKDGLSEPGMNIIMNNGVPAGQTVFHAHIHLIPRKENDGHAMWKGGKYSEGEAEKVARAIISAL